MTSALHAEELIDVVIRLPRRAVEETLLSAPAPNRDPQQGRLEAAKALLAARRRRTTLLKGIRFYDPSWDMILELYVADREHRALAVSQLCGVCGGSTTTALRHLENIEALGYVRRSPDAEDRRRLLVTMCPRLSDALDKWLDLQIAASPLGL
jgi:DNA-binding MarR family transcriptional regulator